MFSLFNQLRGCAKSSQSEEQGMIKKGKSDGPINGTPSKVSSVVAGSIDALGVIAVIVVGALVLANTHTITTLSNTHAIIIMAVPGGSQLVFTIGAVKLSKAFCAKRKS